MEVKKRNYDLRELSKKHPNKWVALSSDHRNLIVVGDKLKDVVLKAKKKDAVFLKLLPSDSFYMPGTM